MTSTEKRYVANKAVELTIAAINASSGMPKPMATRPDEISKLLQATYEKLAELYGYKLG